MLYVTEADVFLPRACGFVYILSAKKSFLLEVKKSPINDTMPSVPGRGGLDSDDEPDPDEVPTARVRQYTDHPAEQWVVYFRPKSKPLNAMRITDDLLKHYPGVKEVTKLHRNKLRVTVASPKEANGIVCDQRFCLEYRVWIPARLVEIDGVVSEDHLTMEQVRKGVGHFRRKNMPQVKVIEVRQLRTSEGEGENRKFIPSNSYRVTFAGTALPDFLEIGNRLRLPVRLYYPRVMSCSNCLQLVHTKAFCSNKPTCAKCGEKHRSENCQTEAKKCMLCGGSVHDTRLCPKYRERSVKLEQEIKNRSKRSFAKIVRTSVSSASHENRFAVLSEEETQPEEEPTEEVNFYQPGRAPKRKKIKIKSDRTQSEKSKRSSTDNLPRSESTSFDRMFPPVVTPTKKKDEGSSQKKDCRVAFSVILDMILSLVSEEIRMLLEPLIPLFRGVVKNLAENSVLASIIRFDI